MSGAAATAAVRLLVGVLVTALVFAGLLFASEVALQVSGSGWPPVVPLRMGACPPGVRCRVAA